MIGSRLRWATVAALGIVGSLAALSRVPASAAAQQGLNAQGPNQAWVFDGSTAAASTYMVALTHAGFLQQIVPPSLGCGADRNGLQPVVAPFGAQGCGVVQPSGSFNFEVSIFPRPPGPSAGPLDLAAVKTDCDALALFDAVQQYLATAQAQALQVKTQVDLCLNKAQRLHCETSQAIQDATLLPPFSTFSIPSFPLGDSDPKTVQSIGEPCSPCAVALAGVPDHLDLIDYELERCTDVLSQMTAELSQLKGFIADNGGLTPENKDRAQTEADAMLGHADHTAGMVADDLGHFNDSTAACKFDKVTASCAACSPGRLRTSLLAQGARQGVRHEFDRESIERIAETLERAGHFDVARRLARVPPRRVLHVTFETTGLVSQHFVALHPTDGPDDGVSPLVIVLTALHRDASPASSLADERRLFDAMRQFHDLLSPTPR